MKRDVKINNRVCRVECEKKAGHIAISVDGRNYQVHAETVAEGLYSFLVNGRSYEALVDRENNHFTVVIEGHCLEVDFYDPRARLPRGDQKSTKVESRQLICAPMAGRIVRFKVAQGDMVEDGEGLIVLEAMKMENELKSQGIGRVKEIMVSEDDVVSPGQQLMVIE